MRRSILHPEQLRRVVNLNFLVLLLLLLRTGTAFAATASYQQVDERIISIQLERVSIRDALLEIEKQSGIKFVFNDQLIDVEPAVSMNFENESVRKVLSFLFKDTNLTYQEVNNNLVITKKPPAAIDRVPIRSGSNTHTPALKVPDAIAVEGKVTSMEDGSELPGVNVYVKGTTVGTITDISGNYRLTVPSEESVLVFSSVGFVSEEEVVGSRTIVDIVLAPDLKTLGEVVVTSFGIEQEKKALGYAVQEVDNQALVETQQPNLVNTLQGKVAGVNITNSGGTPGASSSILIRGATSIDGDNQPLFVVDGIPVDNSTIAEPIGGSGQLARTVSNSNRGLDINPNDIKSITVLKGPAAAALYGLRAANGALIITTKKGATGEGQITYSNSFEWNEANKLPDLQSTYKMGIGGAEVPSRFSWGPQYQGGDQVYNNMEEFFQTGFLMNHNLSFSGGNDRTTFYTSLGRTDQTGIVPETDWKRTSLKLKADTKVMDKLKVGASFNYVNSDSRKPLEGPGVLGGTGGYMVSMLYWPRSDNMANYLNANGSRRTILDIDADQNAAIDNPYWSARNNPVTDEVNRVIAIGDIQYDPFDWLNVTYRLGTDFYDQDFQSLRSPSTSLVGNENGGLFILENFSQISTSNLLVTFKHSFSKLNASLLVGNNVEWANTNSTTLFGTEFNNQDFVGIRNTSNIISDKALSRRRLVGAFANLQLDYNGTFFLNVTGRNDWSSTLPTQNRSFFYPSVGSSIVFTELLNINQNVLSFGKVRATWAQVGKDAPPHKLASSLEANAQLGGGFAFGFFGNNDQLKPERTTSFEVGTDLRFLKGRLGLDLTYYSITSEDQIIQPRVSNGSGYIFQLINGGTIENKGYEVVVNANPVKNDNFIWDLTLNWSKNDSELTFLPEGIDLFVQSDAISVFGLAQGASFLDGPFFNLEGSQWLTDDDGQLVIDDAGYPTIDRNQNLMANRQPDWIGGITNTFSYKSLSLSFLLDFRKGGDVFNGTEYELVRSGLSPRTLARGSTFTFEGVTQDGSANTQTVVLDENYYQNIYASHAPNFIEDGSWARLRYLSLTYQMPARIVDNSPFANVSFNITGKNLWLSTQYSGFDPEVSSGGAGVRGTGSMGIDYAGVPATRGVSIGLNLTL